MIGPPSDSFDAFYLLFPLFYVALTSLAAALTARWWSGFVLIPLPTLLSLGDEISFAFVGISTLMLGLPATVVTALVLRQIAEPPDRILEGTARIVALAIGLIAVVLTWLVGKFGF